MMKYRLMTSLALALAAAHTARGQTSHTMQWTSFVFSSAAGDTVRADSARVTVRENRSKATGATISIAVVRIPSTATKPGTPIIYLAGGPGGSGISGVRGDLFPTVLALRTVSDVILFDQRGTGITLPSLFVRSTFGAPLTQPVTSPDALAGLIANSKAVAAEVRARGIDLTSYNTVENADDVDDIRAALGAPKLIVWGHSYGSHLALAYIKRHGENVERAILGGINGLDHRRRLPHDGDVLFARIDSAIRATPKLNAVMPDFMGTTKRVFARLAENPVMVTVDSQNVLVGKEDVQAVIAIQSGEQAFVRRLPWYIGRMDAGDYSAMARLVRDVVKNRPFGTAMSYPMDLASGVSEARLKRIRQEAPTALLGDAINFPFEEPAFRAAWSPAELGDAFRKPVVSPVPVLLISGTLDGRTSLQDAEEVRRGFKSNAHIIVNGSSHNPYATTPELQRIMIRFTLGNSVKDTILKLSNIEFRGPDESELIAEIQRAGAISSAAAGSRLRELWNDPKHYVTSFVVSGAAQALSANRDASLAVVETGVALFPENSFLLGRLAAARLAAGDRKGAQELYQRAVAADPFNQQAAIALGKPGPAR